MPWRAPIGDISFALHHVVGIDGLMENGAFPDFDGETLAAVLEAGGRLAEEVFAPLNRVGDAIGAQFQNGSVRTVSGFPKAYRAFVEGGWNGLAAPMEYGGQGLPKVL